jgi:hypothetical protein
MGINTLPGADDDPISSFADTQSLSSDTTGESARFPSEILQHIADHDRDKVQERWDKFVERATFGKKKYNTDLDRQDLSLEDWLEHSIQEKMDDILYMQKTLKVVRETKNS